jgi:hypothetical protein
VIEYSENEIRRRRKLEPVLLSIAKEGVELFGSLRMLRTARQQ